MTCKLPMSSSCLRAPHKSLRSPAQQHRTIQTLCCQMRPLARGLCSRAQRSIAHNMKTAGSLPRVCTCRQYATVTNALPSIMVNDLRHQEILVNFNKNHTVRYPSFWLRDHCQCSTCTHPHTKQRQINTFDIDPDVQAVDATSTPDGLEIKWSDSEHGSLYPWVWLSEHIPFSPAPTVKHPRQGWKHSGPASATSVRVDHDSVINTTTGLQTLLHQIRTYGFSFIHNTPPTPEATQSLLERISFIRPTQYGAFWDFTSNPKPVDTAYTNLSLPLHTDTTYFADPAGLQLFHCLQPATQGGGQSTFSDAFAAATALHTQNPDYYNILSSIRVASHASGSSNFGTFMNNGPHASGFPMFTHSAPHIRPHPRNLTQIRWNNDDRHSSTQWPSHERMIMWYRAARAWQELLASEEFQWEVQLEPGTPIIFDNWRIVHGRRAFEGARRVCGGYIGMDEFLARGRAVDDEVRAAGEDGVSDAEKEKESKNIEKVEREQIEEEKEETGRGKGSRKEDGGVEPDVLPQKEEGVDRPIAS